MLDMMEKWQVAFYLAAIAAGLALAEYVPSLPDALTNLLWPILGLLLYVTFTQIPLLGIHNAMRDARFITAALLANFLLLPLLVWGLLFLFPDDPAIRLGVALVLLLPCTDWFVAFVQQGRGDLHQAIAFLPVSLVLQALLLPVYLWLFFGERIVVAAARQEMLLAFVCLIVLPFCLAAFTECWAKGKPERAGVTRFLATLPVPLLAGVVFVIAATQYELVSSSVHLFGPLLLVFSTFLLLTALLAWLLTRLFRLPVSHGRTLAFSLGTRNSFVVLPLALALPSGYELTAVTIVFQSLVELVGMAIFVWWIPGKVFPEQGV
ncbi:MAG: arsenic resistance protein [Pseudohongiella sp.]|uniref:arsenic resistance protein n=1 Tax=Pseudohongiella sp. TaxID=1979412 RepID=UPI0034A01512